MVKLTIREQNLLANLISNEINYLSTAVEENKEDKDYVKILKADLRDLVKIKNKIERG